MLHCCSNKTGDHLIERHLTISALQKHVFFFFLTHGNFIFLKPSFILQSLVIPRSLLLQFLQSNISYDLRVEKTLLVENKHQ